MIQTFNFEPHQKELDRGLARLASEKIITRIWAKDWTVWKPEPDEIANRLGWLRSPQAMRAQLPQVRSLAGSARRAGFRRALVLGMGGSSLAPLVMASVFKTPPGFLALDVLDSTVPEAVLRARKNHPAGQSLFIASSKSGSTAETSSLFSYFWNAVGEAVGPAAAPRHFAVITDPGTPLEALAERLGITNVFSGDPEIGGRFSALSPFGLVPAALKGNAADRTLAAGLEMGRLCRKERNPGENPGAFLGTILGVLARRGLDKLTFILPPRLRTLGLWLEQLIAESTGKEGRGILPVVGEPLLGPRHYAGDRLFVHIGTRREALGNRRLRRLIDAGLPLVLVGMPGIQQLGGQFFLWEFATAVAGRFLGINPFDQPDVETSKQKTREMLAVYRATGSLPAERPQFEEEGIAVFSDVEAASAEACLRKFLAGASPGGYAAIQAFISPGRRADALLARLRRRLAEKTGLAVTTGFGPRFLHSTGQLHKGDAGRGLFLQITAQDRRDAAIPDEPGAATAALTFGVLKAAQARGDLEALKAAGRRVIRLDLGADIRAGLDKVMSFLG